MQKIIFFSHNKNKILEVLKFFDKTQINILSLENFPNTLLPKENGLSFKANAQIKSIYGYKKFKLPCFADDSGICISALNNRPGIKSKRFLNGKESKNTALNYIINETKKAFNNRAYFETSVALTLDLKKTIFFNGRVDGEIATKPSGKHGFDYDPIFIPNGHNKTFAEMTLDKKNEISHRSIAIIKLKKFLLQLVN